MANKGYQGYLDNDGETNIKAVSSSKSTSKSSKMSTNYSIPGKNKSTSDEAC